MRNNLFYPSLLLAAAALVAACSSSEETTAKVSPPDADSRIWETTVTASRDSILGVADEQDAETRAIFYGGNGRRYAVLWDQGDVIHVYKGDNEVGTMSPLQSSWGNYRGTLSGELTGPFAAHEVLSLYLPSRDMNFSGQTGTIYNISSNYSYQTNTTTVEDAADNIAVLNDMHMSHRQAYYRCILQDADSDERLHASTLKIYGSSGQLVKTKAADGTTTYFTDEDPLTITAESELGEYPSELFVALLSDCDGNDTFRFKATVGTDTYVGPTSAMSWTVKNEIGMLYRVLVKMRKTTPATSLVVADIDGQTFTGSAITPAVTVTDGETTLTQGTDYSVNYTDNVAAGTATVTVTGLADAGAVAATKYLGTTTATFSIVKAAPVITMETGDVELVNTATGGHAVTAVTIADGSVDLKAAPYSCSISYESSDPSVATVDAATGVVTGVSSGTCTITAKVAGTGNWNEATSQYTVRVSTSADATNTISTWGNGGSEDDTIKL